MDPLARISLLLLIPFVLLALVDGLYLHLWKFRLHTRPECRLEHRIHTLRAAFLPIALLLLYARNRGGPLLWAGVAVVVVDTAAELADMASERASRRHIGGLGTFEYLVHGLLITLRSTSLALLLASKPAEAWSWASPAVLAPGYEPLAGVLMAAIVPGAVVVALVHAYLGLPRFRAHAAGGPASTSGP